MQTPWLTLLLCLVYLAMCWLGPFAMEGRRPYQLRPVLVVYNLAIVLLSSYMFVEVGR